METIGIFSFKLYFFYNNKQKKLKTHEKKKITTKTF